ncbi:hypothetical protein SPRG_01758 [Saprolegnia parasitica CBS 223.65]|uniref:PX domain-containing protein n=1 Tax=Saprolegnia parasitica (strain CBS 223.65) TaxID=695850 RepID=A0A067CTP4_SAPPC|nr:hypothetical protein SPRG_01758 [Saprolegnia parasitica CBS 223.65]KDO33878.1 hypothetical protein SPRG_01758 [Saprolegnia parasitica CBS 223.65]|eukprot:XP_012195514.1 hypothetical protein SPRG_01758 [Saprolegnia parasitica CBS 223.65]
MAEVMHEAVKVDVFGSYEALDQDSGKFYTEYILRCNVQDPSARLRSWNAARRYREFCAIDILLREKYPHLASSFPSLPSKKYLGSSLSSDFVEKRQRDLGHYISTLLSLYPQLLHDEIMDEFLELSSH